MELLDALGRPCEVEVCERNEEAVVLLGQAQHFPVRVFCVVPPNGPQRQQAHPLKYSGPEQKLGIERVRRARREEHVVVNVDRHIRSPYS